MLELSIFIVVLTASVLLFRKVAGSLSPLKPNLISIIFYYSLLISSFIGSVLIALDIDHYYMINRLDHEKYRLIGFLCVSFVMLFLPLTMLMVNKLLGFDSKREFNEYLKKPIHYLSSTKRDVFFWLFFILSSISILSVVYTLLMTETIPLFELLKGNSADLAMLRIEASRSFNGYVYVRNIFAIALTPILSLIAYIVSYQQKTLRWKLLFLILFSLSILISIYDLAKSPVFFYIIMFILIRLYIGSLKLNWKRISVYLIMGGTVLIGMYVSIQGVSNISEYLSYSSGPIGRIILAQISPAFLHLNLFNESIPFLQGQSLPSILISWLDIENVRSARLVMENTFPNKVDDGTAGVLNTLFIGEAYANFGYLGILFGTLYLGVLIQIVYICFLRLPKNPVFIGLFVYFTVNIPRTLVGGFADFLFNPIWVFITFVLIGLLVAERLLHDIPYLRKKFKLYK
ncbi:O-antigen polymerase [Bacillus sp. P14.5]|uniref:O-antigen polymerase n=1 Tax=Bacillus sp. P14.5 TaxID=1983400 RepID=UPI000DEAFD21|nr:O-antigen polymerase [Bacillus sp. P14.5]